MPIINCNQFQRIWNGGFAPLRRSFCTITLVDGIEITIGGEDRSSSYRPASLSIKEDLNTRGTADFILEDPDNDLSITTGQSIIIRKNTLTPTYTERLLFAGTVDVIEDRWPTMDITSPFHQIKVKAVDNNAIASRFLVARRYEAGSLPGEIAEDIRERYLSSEGVTAGNIENGEITLGQVDFNFESVSDALNELSELVGFIWYIDHDRKLYFQARDTTSASFGYSDSSLPIRSLKRKQSRQGYRNRQYLRAGRDIQINTNAEDFAGDGERRSFTVGLPIGEEPTVTLNGSSQTIGVNGIAAGKNWYWQKGSNTIEQDRDLGSILETDDILRVTYRGLLAIIVQADDSTQQEERAAIEGGSGIYEQIEDDEKLESGDFALSRASGLLNRYGAIKEIVSISTDEAPLRAGQVQTIELTREGLSGEYLIQSLSAKDRGDGEMRYSYKCVDGAQFGGWVDFFTKLARAGRVFEIRDNEIYIFIRERLVNLMISDTGSGSTDTGLDPFADDPFSVFMVAASGAATVADPTGAYIGTVWISEDGSRRAAGGKIGDVRNG